MTKRRSRSGCYINTYHGRAYLSIGNNAIYVTRLEYCSEKAGGLSGYKIIHISDLHNHEFGDGQYNLLCCVKNERPNIIVVTGDLIDKRRIDIKIAASFIKEAVKTAPVYYVTGNHEIRSDKYTELSLKLKLAGAVVMDNDSITIKHSSGEFELIGLKDASSFCFDPDTVDASAKEKIEDTLKRNVNLESPRLKILLTHRPEFIDIYSKCGIDIVFSGHAHGGQVRLPFIGGLFAPGQGVFPQYTSGMYTFGNTSMIVSRGLGNSLFPLRIFNPPEVVAITLKDKKP